MESVASIALKKLMHPDYVEVSSKSMDCDIHGVNVEALINGKCADCFRDKRKEDRLKEFEEKLLRAKEKSLIPYRFRNSTFSNYTPVNDKSKILLEFCQYYQFDKNILMLGNTGTGKTHLACALVDQGIKNNWQCIYVKFYQLADIKIKKPKLFDELLDCQFLVIDEYGQQDSDFKSNLLFEIIDQRYDNEDNTLLISNLSADKFKTSISAPLYSRLKENVTVKSCDWEDYRLRAKE